MSMTTASLLALPSELLYQILKYLDTYTIIFKFCHVCKRFYEITDDYNQCELNFNSTSYSHMKRILRLIKPENITSLICGGDSYKSSDIELLSSIVNISPLTFLRSITLDYVTASKDYELLNRLTLSNLSSLSIHT
ncbi:unnamed protein product [Adineta ricciae]|uniref:F-box domain-containing protein n=1 Tax=Adineta ricciae TaxID=249248 RepID=A0A815LY64_ADIRI|nr:unnamed protein product [Adineta ricciae]CAF1444731.1 unnamed protein product [Adineta ricciae]